MNPFIRGAVSGGLAIIPMTMLMSEVHRYMLEGHEPLPPRQLAMKLLDLVGSSKGLSEDAKLMVTMMAHFFIGISAAIAMPFLDALKMSFLNRGLVLGICVWIAGYFLIVPLVKFDVSAYGLSTRRNLLMFVSHLVWGLSVGVFYNYSDKKFLSGF